MESYYDKESHNNQKKIAVINDLTGFGRCAPDGSHPCDFCDGAGLLSGANVHFVQSYGF